MEINQIWEKLSIQKRFAIVSTFLFGLIAHAPMMFNKFSKHDDIGFMFQGGVTFRSGRWMLFVLEKIKNFIFQDSVYNIPLTNSLVSFICLAISACILIDIFEIKSNNLCTLLAAVMVSIPVVTCMFGYMFIAQFFSIAILFAVLGSYLVLTEKRWYLILTGIILMACSVGVYQAYIPVMLCIFLFGLIKRYSEVKNNSERKGVFIRTGIIIFSCGAFLIVYKVVLNYFLHKNNIELSGYKGIGYATKIPLTIYFQRALFAYREFFLPKRGSFYDVFPGISRQLYMFSIVLSILLFITFVHGIAKKSKLNALIICLLGFFVPLAVNFIFVMVDETFCYVMMVYGYAMYFTFFIWLSEQVKRDFKQKISGYVKTIVTAMLCVIVFIFCRYDNLCYMKLEITQAQTTRFYTSLITRIQDVEGYDASMPVAFISHPQIHEFDTTIPEIQELNHIRISPFWGFRESINTEPWRAFMEIWGLFRAWETDSSKFEYLPEVQNMPSYPNDGSITIIDGTLVVKF